MRTNRTKNPPTFHYLPKTSAKRLKKSWVEDRKIRSKWKAQKRRERLTSRSSTPVENASSLPDDETNDDADSEPNTSLDIPHTVPSSSHGKQSLHDLRKIAYASKPIPTQIPYSSHQKPVPVSSRRSSGGKATVRRETGQPNMKLRMNILLEKIKRDFT